MMIFHTHMYKTGKKILVLLISFTLLSACASKKENKPPPSQINGFPSTAQAGPDISQIRFGALRETATGIGAQTGLAWQSKRVNQILDQNEHYLNQIFNFQPLILENNVLPPVLSQGIKALNVDDPETLRLADKIYKIESPPRFVTAAPTWREYLWLNFSPPEAPNNSLLPRNQEERDIWNQYVIEGWKDGVQQANGIFAANLGRLRRDYNGMLLYRTLLAQNMVTAPYVGKTDMGVTGDDNQMRINDQILRITATSKLIPNSSKWKTIVVPGTVGAIRIQGLEGTEGLE